MSFFYSCRAMFQALLTVSLGLTGAQALSQQDTAFPQTMNEGVIHDTARMGNREALERLLHATPSLRDARTPLGALPMHYAAMNPDSGPLKALVAAGSNPNARDIDGRTPLHMAAFSTQTANAMLLLQAGADPLLKTNDGRDVLSMARKVRADVLAGEVSLWILKGCKPARPC
jgi:ankyrin repeat protein